MIVYDKPQQEFGIRSAEGGGRPEKCGEL